ncbi:MAG: hypothetical protein EXQ88_05670 [Alphaproteobacteria bacterium]|nr:hypothetical protein [Alphaproteobacteria bacterium]
MSDTQRQPSPEADAGALALTVYAHSKALFVWPLVPLALVTLLLSDVFGVNTEATSWLFFIGLALILTALVYDVGRASAIIIILLLLVLALALLWLGASLNAPLFGEIYAWLNGLDIQVNQGFVSLVAAFAVLLLVVDFVGSRLVGRWVLRPNEFESRSFGRRALSLARAGKSVTTSYDDLAELLLCLAGAIEIRDERGYLVARIAHVPLLPLKTARLDRILESQVVYTQTLPR